MRIICSIAIGSILISCGNEEAKVAAPEVLGKPDLISVMVDLQVLEAHFHRMYIRPDRYSKALDSSSFYIFRDHHTSKAQFEQSLLYYSAVPDSMFRIYESALDSVNQRVAKSTSTPM
jgi:hypothetical protein